MSVSRTLLFAGATAVALAGAASLANAQTDNAHVMTVQLPNGAVEQVRYTGDVPPQVVLAPDASPIAMSAAAYDPFVVMQRISAMMDQQAAEMLSAFGGMADAPFASPLTQAGFGMLPHGANGNRVMSIRNVPGVCMRSLEITYTGNGQAPHVVSQTSGDCGAAHGAAEPAELPATPAPSRGVKTIQVKADGAQSYQAMVHPIVAWQR
jgi:hypothetical protein